MILNNFYNIHSIKRIKLLMLIKRYFVYFLNLKSLLFHKFDKFLSSILGKINIFLFFSFFNISLHFFFYLVVFLPATIQTLLLHVSTRAHDDYRSRDDQRMKLLGNCFFFFLISLRSIKRSFNSFGTIFYLFV